MSDENSEQIHTRLARRIEEILKNSDDRLETAPVSFTEQVHGLTREQADAMEKIIETGVVPLVSRLVKLHIDATITAIAEEFHVISKNNL